MIKPLFLISPRTEEVGLPLTGEGKLTSLVTLIWIHCSNILIVISVRSVISYQVQISHPQNKIPTIFANKGHLYLKPPPCGLSLDTSGVVPFSHLGLFLLSQYPHRGSSNNGTQRKINWTWEKIYSNLRVGVQGFYKHGFDRQKLS